MCGFAGFLGTGMAGQVPDLEQVLRGMGHSIAHRGPDDAGVWLDAPAGIGLAHQRLAIVDLSAAGHQPMVAASGRYVLAYNGEIYNHLELRGQLASLGVADWRGHSDTETLLAAVDAWGVQAAVERVIGMFAFALWDRRDATLTLCRDRLGEKPLYCGWQGATFLFGSELKALRVHPAFRAGIDRNALALLMRHNYIPAPYSIYQGIHKLLPGSLLTVSTRDRDHQPRPYWDARQVVATGLAKPFSGTPMDAVDTLDTLLRDAVGRQMAADVPLGAFLSGGVDSSLVVALMQAQSTRPVKTFTIGFHEQAYNEAHHAQAVARHLGTDHTELYLSAQEAIAVIPDMPRHYDEPFADASQIPTCLVARMTRQHVTVSLSGDGGDELFGGYTRYLMGEQLWARLSRLPPGLRRLCARLIRSGSATAWNRLLGPVQACLPHHLAQANIGDKLHKGAGVLAAGNAMDLYRLLVSHWNAPGDIVPGAIEPPTVLTEPAWQPQAGDSVHQMMALDMLSYLPDDILVKVDRAAMAVSLETRVPLLDHRVVEFAWSLPLSYKLRRGVGKWPLREVLARYLPRPLIERPKMGFGVPLADWLRGPLREWAEDLLGESALQGAGHFHPALVRQRWSQHLSGQHDWAYPLWDVLMAQAWLQAQVPLKVQH